MSMYSRKKQELREEIAETTLRLETAEKVDDKDYVNFLKKEKSSLEQKLRTIIRKEKEE